MSGGTAIRQARRKRDPLERWYTPPELARFHLEWALRHSVWDAAVVDPCAGAGAYVDAARGMDVPARGYDLAPGRSDIIQNDARKGPMPHCGHACVTNPPFTLAGELVPRMLEAYSVVSLLLPVSALERTQDRAPVWDGHPPTRIAHIGRVRFEGPALTYGLEEGDKPRSGAQQCYALVLWSGGPWTRWEWLTPPKGGS